MRENTILKLANNLKEKINIYKRALVFFLSIRFSRKIIGFCFVVYMHFVSPLIEFLHY